MVEILAGGEDSGGVKTGADALTEAGTTTGAEACGGSGAGARTWQDLEQRLGLGLGQGLELAVRLGLGLRLRPGAESGAWVDAGTYTVVGAQDGAGAGSLRRRLALRTGLGLSLEIGPKV